MMDSYVDQLRRYAVMLEDDFDANITLVIKKLLAMANSLVGENERLQLLRIAEAEKGKQHERDA